MNKVNNNKIPVKVIKWDEPERIRPIMSSVNRDYFNPVKLYSELLVQPGF